ncbi:uncharacterized protein [Equus caballus]|uniref:uncharacterized protein n=1 Tax=Equus caballus TaxID=9796 RepID=UPI0038B3D15F
MDEEGLARETVEAEKAHSVPSANQRPSKVGGAAPVHARGLRSRTPVFAGRRTRRSQPSGEPIHPSSTFVLFEPPWIGDVLLHCRSCGRLLTWETTRVVVPGGETVLRLMTGSAGLQTCGPFCLAVRSAGGHLLQEAFLDQNASGWRALCLHSHSALPFPAQPGPCLDINAPNSSCGFVSVSGGCELPEESKKVCEKEAWSWQEKACWLSSLHSQAAGADTFTCGEEGIPALLGMPMVSHRNVCRRVLKGLQSFPGSFASKSRSQGVMKSSRVEESAEVLRLERNPVVPRSHVSCLRVRKPVLPVTGFPSSSAAVEGKSTESHDWEASCAISLLLTSCLLELSDVATMPGMLGAAALLWTQSTSASGDSSWGELVKEEGVLGGQLPRLPSAHCPLPDSDPGLHLVLEACFL